MMDVLGEYTVQILFGVWAIGFMLSIPLSIFVITVIGKNLPKEKVDMFIPMSIFFGMIFNWAMVFVLIIIVMKVMISDILNSRSC